MTTPVACPGFYEALTVHKTRSVFAYYMFLMALIFVVYSICGVLYNVNKYSATGLDAIPHIDSWRNVPCHIQTGFRAALEWIGIGIVLARGFVKSRIDYYKQV